MGYIELSQEGAVLRIALNRPEKRNALNFEMCRELVRAVRDAGRDNSVGSILLCGRGSAFCGGLDLTDMGTPEAQMLSHVHEQVFSLGAQAMKPIIAAVEGPAMAGGTGLVAMAHIAVAGEDATFGLAEIHFGLWPFLVFGDVAAAVGRRRAMELALTGRSFTAAEAFEWGLIHYLTPPGGAVAKGMELATTVSEQSRDALRSGLRFVAETSGRTIEDTEKIAFRYRAEVMKGEEYARRVKRYWP